MERPYRIDTVRPFLISKNFIIMSKPLTFIKNRHFGYIILNIWGNELKEEDPGSLYYKALRLTVSVLGLNHSKWVIDRQLINPFSLEKFMKGLEMDENEPVEYQDINSSSGDKLIRVYKVKLLQKVKKRLLF